MTLWLTALAPALAGALDAAPSLVGPGAEQGCRTASPAGDLDGDGRGDLVVGCPYDDTAGHEAGAAYVVLDVDALEPYTPLVEAGLVLGGAEPQDHAGFDVAALGDFDGDGLDDVAISAPEASTDLPAVGKVYVVSGGELSAGALEDHTVIRGGDHWGRVGERLYGPQDLDGDGLGDLLVGAPYPTPAGTVAAGWLGAIHGSDTALSTQVLSIDISPGTTTSSADAAWVHSALGTLFGRAALVVDDRTGDGLPELLVGAPGLTAVAGASTTDHPEGKHPAGSLYLFPSRPAAEVLALPVLDQDEALGVVGGDATGDALPWTLSAVGSSVALGSPEAGNGAGVVHLLEDFAGEALVGDRALATLTGRTEGDLTGWSLAKSAGDLVEGGTLWIAEPGWSGGAGRLLLVDPGSGDAQAPDRAVGSLQGCWPGGQAGFDLGRGTLDPSGDATEWLALSVPYASIDADRDGLVVILDDESIATALAATCEAGDTGGGVPDRDGDGHDEDTDCDDSAAWRHPGAPEVCGDGVDDDCDGEADESCGPPATPSPGRCGGGPASGWPALVALGLVAGGRRRSSPRLQPVPDLQLPNRWRSALPLALLALPGLARAADAEDLATASLWGSAASEFLHGPVVGGDFDGDGQGDLAVANFQGAGLAFAIGEVHLLPGELITGAIDLATAPVELHGEEEHDYFGVDVAVVPGDPDGLWVGMDRTGLTENEPGHAMLYLEPLALHGLRGIDEADLILSGDANLDAFGRTLAVGDLDADGLPDVAIGAPQRDDDEVQTAGRVWLIHADGAPLTGAHVVSDAATATLDGGADLAGFGWRLMIPGDLDGDGKDDLVVGSLGATPSSSGLLEVFTELDPAEGLDPNPAGTWAGETAGDEAGHGLDQADWDEDGAPEVVVGAPWHAQGRGRVWLLDGAPAGIEKLGDAALLILDGETGETLGHSLAAGPLLLLGAPGTDRVHGADFTGRLSWTLDGPEELGHHVSWVGDLDGDGTSEAAVVAPAADGDKIDQGVAYVLSGTALVAGAVGGDDTDLDGDGSPAGEDCDDADPRRAPDHTEVCRNDIDDDCDRIVDEESCARGCAAADALPALGLALLALAAVVRRRAAPLVLAGWLSGCGGSGEAVLDVPIGPVASSVPLTLTGDGERLTLSVDGVPLAGGPGPELSVDWDSSTVVDGSHVIRGASWPAEGAPAEDWVEVVVDQVSGDAEPPEVTFRSPVDGQVLPLGADVFVSLLVDDDVGIEEVRLYRYGGALHGHGIDDLLALLPPEGPWELAWADADPGLYELEAVVTDLAGRVTAEKIAFEVSSTAPITCTIVSPEHGAEVSGTVDIKVAASSVAGIASVALLVDGTEIATDETSPWGASWDAGTSPREVALEALCTASDGATATAGIVVDVVEESEVALEATITRPLDGDTVSGDVQIRAAVGGGNGPESVTFLVDDTEVFVDEVSPWEATWDSTAWPDGEAVLHIVGVEAGTGDEASDEISVTVANGG